MTELGAEAWIFAVAAPIAVVAGAGAVFRRGPLGAALSLTIALFALAVLYLSLGAQFLAAVQIAVYAGAVMVLLVFVIMLLGAARAPEIVRVASPRLGIAGALIAVALFSVLAAAVLRGRLPVTVSVAPPPDDVNAVATALFGAYVFPFEVASVLLLAAMIGAITLVRKRSTEREWPR